MSERVDFCRADESVSEQPFHYTACGLDWVYLLNGVLREKDPDYGELVTVKSEDELLKAIAAHIIEKDTLSGREFRFLRKFMGLTQEQLAEEFQVDVQTVANYEKRGAMPKPSKRLMKWLTALSLFPPDTKIGVMKSIGVNRRDAGQRETAFRRERGRIIPHWRERAPRGAA